MHSAKRTTLRRFWIIDRELRAAKYPTAPELAAIAEVDEQTIRRDIRAMQFDLKAPIDFNKKRKGWEYTETTYRLPAVIITEGELVAMFLAGQALRQAVGTSFAADLKRAIEKLSELLPDEVSIQWQDLDQVQSFHHSVVSPQDLDIFQNLAGACLHRKQLNIHYWTASRDEDSHRIVDPYHLASIDGTWYMLAFCHERKAIRTFAAARIREVVETGRTFERPADFRIGDYFEGTFKVVSSDQEPMQTVKLKFAASAAKYVRERIWHKSQKLHVNPDQSATLELSLRSLIEIRRWVLSWGSECEVLAPTELRADIHREAKSLLSQSEVSALDSSIPEHAASAPANMKPPSSTLLVPTIVSLPAGNRAASSDTPKSDAAHGLEMIREVIKKRESRRRKSG